MLDYFLFEAVPFLVFYLAVLGVFFVTGTHPIMPLRSIMFYMFLGWNYKHILTFIRFMCSWLLSI